MPTHRKVMPTAGTGPGCDVPVHGRTGPHAEGIPLLPQRPASGAVHTRKHQDGKGSPEERRHQHQRDRYQGMHAASVDVARTNSKSPWAQWGSRKGYGFSNLTRLVRVILSAIQVTKL